MPEDRTPAAPAPAVPGPVPASGPPSSLVVVGAGLAATGTVAALRSAGWTGHVTVLGAEGTEPYDRPPLSKHLLDRPEPTWLRDEIGADLDGADDVRLAERATGLAVGDDGVEVRTAAGAVRADAVVLATGAHAVRPPGWSAARTLHTAADAAELRARLRPGARLVVVGAGWIGAEVAGVAAAARCDVTVVEAAPAPLAGALGPAVGALTVPWYAAAGVRLLLGTGVAGVAEDAVTLTDGQVLEADVVLAAVGARPTTAWLGGVLPLAGDGSLRVDERHRVLAADGTPLARVLAVGDVARRRSARHGWVPGGHWDGAVRGPATVVRTLLGDPAPPDDPAPYVFSTQLGHELGMHGLPAPDDDVVLRGDPTGPFTVLWFRPGTDVLTGALAVDRPRDVSAARRLFRAPDLPRVDRTAVTDPATPLR